MIILSGVLVVVAIALLIAGIVAGNSGTEVVGLDGLNLIYVSIAVSIVSALFLAIGVFVRRKELFGSPATGATGPAARTAKHGKAGRAGKSKAGEAATARPASGDTTTAASGGISVQPAGGHVSGTDIDTAELAATTPSAADVPATAVVYVVPGRRRYHIDSCRQLAGRDKEELTFEEAREEGFSPCTACMPDTALAARAATGDLVTTDEPDTSAEGETETAVRPSAAAESDDERGIVGRGHLSMSNGMGYVTPVQRQALDDLTEDDDPAAPATEPLGRLSGEGLGDAAEHGPAGDEAAAEAETTTHTTASEPRTADAGGEATDAEPDVPHQATRSMAAADAGHPEASVASADAPEPGTPEEGGGPLVRILSGTKRYHRPNCALIEDIGDDADDLESLSRAEAQARGCTPCLVCQPDKEPATRD